MQTGANICQKKVQPLVCIACLGLIDVIVSFSPTQDNQYTHTDSRERKKSSEDTENERIVLLRSYIVCIMEICKLYQVAKCLCNSAAAALFSRCAFSFAVARCASEKKRQQRKWRIHGERTVREWERNDESGKK